MNDPITVAQAAVLLDISAMRVRQLIQTGRLSASKMGPIWLVERMDLAAVRVRKVGRPAKPAAPDPKPTKKRGKPKRAARPTDPDA